MRRSANLNRPETIAPELRAWLGDDGEVEKYSDAESPRRPRTRGECKDGPRPCGFLGCRYNLAIDIGYTGRSIKFNHPLVDITEMAETCALDVADRGPVGLPELAKLMGLSYDRAFQTVDEALAKLHEVAGADVTAFADRPGRPGMSSAHPGHACRPERAVEDQDISRLVRESRPTFPPAPFRRPARDEVERLFPGAAVHPDYGKPLPSSVDAEDRGPWWTRRSTG